MDTQASEEPAESSPTLKRNLSRWIWVIDIILFLLLTFAAYPARIQNAKGDLWGDEGDYALASVRSFHAHRWDLSDDPNKPLDLIELRHYHPPLLSYILKIAHHYGTQEQNLRLPFVLAGCISVGLTYLCGVTLFGGRREIAIGAALLALLMPIHIRSSAHAIPWPFIGLFFISITWTLLKYVETKCAAWLTETVTVLGLLFTHSEMFYPALVMVALTLPLLFLPDIREKKTCTDILKAVGIGIVISLVLIGVLWPVGPIGGSFRMLTHYIGVSKEQIPVVLSGVMYPVAPKWAYIFWLWRDYKPYAILYSGGFVGAILLLVFRKGSRQLGIVVVACLLLIAVAHRAHIIGPEYLAHITPFLALIVGLGFQAVIMLWRPLGWVVMIYCCGAALYWKPDLQSSNIDPRTLDSRWPAASAYLKQHWKPGDNLVIGPQTVGVGRWYIRYVAGIDADDAHILPLQVIKPGRKMMSKIASGQIRYIQISSVFVDRPEIDPILMPVMKRWNLVYRSNEGSDYYPRMRLYEVPAEIRKRYLTTHSNSSLNSQNESAKEKARP